MLVHADITSQGERRASANPGHRGPVESTGTQRSAVSGDYRARLDVRDAEVIASASEHPCAYAFFVHMNGSGAG